MKKQKVEPKTQVIDRHEFFDLSRLNGLSPQELSDFFSKETERTQNNTGETFKLEVDYYGYDGGVETNWVVWREETDKEYSTRMKKLEANERQKEKDKVKALEAERAQYERLKKKFG